MTEAQIRAHIDAVVERERLDLASGLAYQSELEVYDVAWEDSEGRLPIDPGYCGRWQREAEAAKRVRERVLQIIPVADEEELDRAMLGLARELAAA